MSTTTVLGTLLGLLTAAGVVLLISGLVRTERPERVPTRAAGGFGRARAAAAGGLGRRDLIILAAAGTAGIVYGGRSGFWVMGLLIPAVVWGLPKLLADPPTTSVAKLDALQQWTRKLSGLIEAGYVLKPAITTSAQTAPPAIRAEVQMLSARLRSSQSSIADLYRFGDELADPVADKVVATLIKASSVDELSLAPILGELSKMVSDEVGYRQATTLAQTSPRATARKVTYVTVAASFVFILFTSYGETYREPLGQLVLLVLAGLYGLLLWWIRVQSTAPPVPRWLVTPARYATGGRR